MNRRTTLLALLVSGVAPRASLAKQSGKIWRIGYLNLGTRQNAVDLGRIAALLNGMREQGYVESKNFVLEARFADGDSRRLDVLAAELVRLKVDVILATGSAVSRVAQLPRPPFPSW